MAVISLKWTQYPYTGFFYYYDTATRKTYREYDRLTATSAMTSLPAQVIDSWCEDNNLIEVYWPGSGELDTLISQDIDPRLHEESEFNLPIQVTYESERCTVNDTVLDLTRIDQEVDGTDTTVTISATGSRTPLTYSIDGTTYQSSNEFTVDNTGLEEPQVYIAYVKDADGNVKKEEFNLLLSSNYGTRWRGEFDDNEGNTWKCNVQKLGYTGSVTEVDMGGNPLQIRWYKKGDYKFTPIKGSEATITLNSSTNYQFSDLFTSQDIEYRLQVLKNDTDYWMGFIIQNSFREPYIAPGYFVTATFTDGLGRLKKKDFTQAAGSDFDTIKCDLDLLRIALWQTNLRLPFKVSLDLLETNMITEGTTTTTELNDNYDFASGQGSYAEVDTGNSWTFGTVAGTSKNVATNNISKTTPTKVLEYPVSIDPVIPSQETYNITIEYYTGGGADDFYYQLKADPTDGSEVTITTQTVATSTTIQQFKKTHSFTSVSTHSSIGVYFYGDSDTTEGTINITQFSIEKLVVNRGVESVRNPLEYAYKSTSAWSDDEDVGTYYDVLKDVLSSYGARVYQREGYWHIDRPDLVTKDYVAERFTAGGKRDDTEMYTNPSLDTDLSDYSQTAHSSYPSASSWSHGGGSSITTSGTTASEGASQILYQSVTLKSGVEYYITIDWSGDTDPYDAQWKVIGDVSGDETELASLHTWEQSNTATKLTFIPDADLSNVGIMLVYSNNYTATSVTYTVNSISLKSRYELIEPVTALTDASTTPRNVFVEQSAALELVPAVNSVEISTPLLYNKSLLTNPEFESEEDDGTNVFKDWYENDITVTKTTISLNDGSTKAAMRLSGANVTDFTSKYVYHKPSTLIINSGETDLELNMRFLIQKEDTISTQVRIMVQVGSYYLDEFGEWQSSVTYIDKTHSGDEINSFINYTLKTRESVPSQGLLNVRIYAASEPGFGGTAANLIVDSFNIKYLKFSEPYDPDQVYKVDNPGDYLDKDENVELKFFDVNIYTEDPSVLKNSIYINDTSTLSASWSYYGQSQNKSLVSLLASRLITHQKRHMQRINGRIYSTNGIGLNTTFTDTNNSGRKFLVSALDYDVRENIFDAELTEFVDTDLEGVLDFLERENGIYLKYQNSKNIELESGRSGLSFKSVASGNWTEPGTWNVQNSSGDWVTSTVVPGQEDDVLIDKATTVTIDQDVKCNDIGFNGAQDQVRVSNPSSNVIEVYGSIYTTDSDGNQSGGSNGSGNAGWLEDMILKVKGASRALWDSVNYIFTANSRTAGWKLIIDPGEGVTITGDSTIRCGYLEVWSGTLDSDNDVRIAGTDYTSGDGDLQANVGYLLVKDGAKFKTFNIYKNTPTVVGQSLQYITVESGGTLEAASSISEWSTTTWNFNGILEVNNNWPLPTDGNKADSVELTSVADLHLKQVGDVTLVNNLQITNLLKVFTASTFMDLDVYTLTYDTSADVEYAASLGTVTLDTDMIPASGSGTSIPNDLIIGSGTTLDLGGNTINIRGSRLGSGTVTNGTLNENQP